LALLHKAVCRRTRSLYRAGSSAFKTGTVTAKRLTIAEAFVLGIPADTLPDDADNEPTSDRGLREDAD